MNPGAGLLSISPSMSADLIVSYDGTANDDDALVFGKLLATGGASMALAYVRHAREFDARREELAQHDADRRLEHGAAWLGDPDVARHVVVSASTGEGLAQLAAEEHASMIVFGSDYRTPPGHAEPGTSAQHLLEGGSVAIAVAAAGLRIGEVHVGSIAVLSPDGDSAASETAQALAQRLGATLVDAGPGEADLFVVGSNGPVGRINLTGAARTLLNRAEGSVLVLPAGHPVQLP
jgi:nucleotide-binding universal stress UspA family protein